MPVPIDPVSWYDDVLGGLGLGSTQPRTMSLYLWARSEGMPPTAFNWLAATDPRPGSTPFNGAGVQVYPSYAVGIEVLVTKLSSALYRPVLLALHADDPELIWKAANASGWCPKCQNGRYPIALYDWLAAGKPATGVLAGGVAPTPGQQTGPRPDSWHDKVERGGIYFSEGGLSLGAHARAIDSLHW